MKPVSATLLFFFLCAKISAQANLVPNPGFDSISSCPSIQLPISLAPPWVDPNAGSSDLYNTCSSNNQSSVPASSTGWQMPYNGNGYAGIVTYVDNSCCPNHREYIQTQLLTPLVGGKTYCVSFRVSWADSVRGATDGMGAYFSQGAISCSGCFLPYTPQVSNPSGHVLNNGSQWEVVQGSFVAQGGEEYITIGNFETDGNTTFQLINNNAFYIVAYYYIDDVSVIEIAPCVAGNNVSVCPGDSVPLGITPVPGVTYSWSPAVGLSDTTAADPTAKPTTSTTYTLTQTQCDVVSTATVTVTVKSEADCMPALVIPTLLIQGEMLKITGSSPGSRLVVYDTAGRKVFASDNYAGEFGGLGVAAGNYIVWLTLPDGNQYRQKLCVVK